MTRELTEPVALPQLALDRLAAPDAPTIKIEENDLLPLDGPGVHWWDFGILRSDADDLLISVGDDEGMIGFTNFFDVDFDAWFVKVVAVMTGDRGVGHGRRLFATALNEMARWTPRGSVTWRVQPANVRSNRMSERMGAEAITARSIEGVLYYARLGDPIGREIPRITDARTVTTPAG